jgi:ribosomal protein L3 glutamine methyltransferase
MKQRKAAESGLLQGADRLATLGAWLDFAENVYDRANLAVGQVATNAHDEALYLLLRTLRLPLESDSEVLAKRLTTAERKALRDVLRRRAVDRIPAAYLTKEAWLGENRFYVDERVIIPRSYFLELIPDLALASRAPRIADVCTGSGCLAILLARKFPGSTVDAIDLSADALAVAAINVRDYRLTRRVKLHRSDCFDAVPPARYDLILSNPPYEPSAHVEALAPEFKREPRMALDGGTDGLDVVRKLLQQARKRLAPRGKVLIEVGGLRAAIDREFSALAPEWLPTFDGANCICAIEAARVRQWAG